MPPVLLDLATCAPGRTQRTRHAAMQRRRPQATHQRPQTHQSLACRASRSNYAKGHYHNISTVSFRSRHLRAEEDTTDAPHCDSTTRPRATHLMPSRARSVRRQSSNYAKRHHIADPWPRFALVICASRGQQSAKKRKRPFLLVVLFIMAAYGGCGRVSGCF